MNTVERTRFDAMNRWVARPTTGKFKKGNWRVCDRWTGNELRGLDRFSHSEAEQIVEGLNAKELVAWEMELASKEREDQFNRIWR